MKTGAYSAELKSMAGDLFQCARRRKSPYTIWFIVVAASLVTTLSARAEYVGLSWDDFRTHYRAQRMSQWCWAASAEMVLSTQGINVPHDAIVQRVKGYLGNQPGSIIEMASAVNGVHSYMDGSAVVVSGQPVTGAPTPEVLYNHMRAGLPAILTYKGGPIGHAVVLFGIDAEITMGGLQIQRLHVADPYPVVPVVTWRGQQLEYDPNSSYRAYTPTVVIGQAPWQRGVAIEPGLITSVTLVTGSRVP